MRRSADWDAETATTVVDAGGAAVDRWRPRRLPLPVNDGVSEDESRRRNPRELFMLKRTKLQYCRNTGR